MSFARNLLFAARSLRKSPGFFFLAVITLGLGIAANTAIFSLFYQVLLRSLPVPDPSSLVVFHSEGFHMSGSNSSDNFETVFSYPLYRALRDSAHSFRGLAIRSSRSGQMTMDGSAERIQTEVVSGNFFDVLELRPRAGRLLSASDDKAGAGNPVVVLSSDYWTKRFGASASCLNRTLSIDGTVFTIVGVAPEGFRGVLSGNSPDLYLSVSMLGVIDDYWKKYDKPDMSRFTILGRLSPGVARERALAELQPVFASTIQNEMSELKIKSARQRQTLSTRRLTLLPAAQGLNQLERNWKEPLVVLASMVALLLLIGCANLANLLLARGVNRSRETAIRLALGAGRGRIVSMLLAESLVISLGGALLGILASPLLTSGVLRLLPADETGGWLAGGVSLPVLAFCTLLMVAAGVISGIAPAWQSSKIGAGNALGDRSATAGSGHLSPRVRQGLVIGQLAVSLVLLSTAGLFGKSLVNLMRKSPGFDASNVLSFSIDAGAGGYKGEPGSALYRQVTQRLTGQPGVESVSMSLFAPFSDSEASTDIKIEGHTAADGENMDSDTNAVWPGFFRTLGTPLVAGREFTERDAPAAPKVAIVNQAFVKRYVGNRNPIGMHMSQGGPGPLDMEIVGVVRDIDNRNLRETVKPTYYTAYEQTNSTGRSFPATIFVRGKGSVEALTAMARAAVVQADRTLPVFDIVTMQTRIENSIYTDRLLAALTTAFGLVALILTAVGLYGVIAYVVGRRTAEMGIRMALGATSGNVMALVLREVGLLIVVGAAAGVVCAVEAMHAIRSLLYGLDGFDPAVLGATVAVLALVALAAGAVPAVRAARIQPLTALRHE
jgi:predicted permease